VTRRVLISDSLPTLRSGNAELDRWVEQHLQTFVKQTFEQFKFLTPSEDEWTAAIRGAGTAGTYEIASQLSYYYRIGDWVFLTTQITLAAAVTGGGTSSLNITGVPFVKRASHNPVGTVVFTGVNWTAGANLAVSFVSSSNESSTLQIVETTDDAAVSALVIGSLAANDIIFATIAYLTNGERS
jgi:hypothetical protein